MPRDRNPHYYHESSDIFIETANHDVDPTAIPARGRPAVLGPVLRAIKREREPGSGELKHHLMVQQKVQKFVSKV